jgi:endonuclease/exonuclease/phosphatase family metal-dependent hydrolase
VTIIRIMTYNVRRCRGADGQINPERILKVIAEGAPDIVALQEIGDQKEDLKFLSKRLGMTAYGAPLPGGNAFLSYYPLRGVQEFELGCGGNCLRADADIHGRRIHLFNLRLDTSPLYRRRQISALLGPDLLSHPSLACPLLVLGDFGDVFWGVGNMRLTFVLRKAPLPLWSSTYPSRFPVAGRDRAYLRGEISVIESSILRSAMARQASSHLPLLLTVRVADPRTYLRLEHMNTGKMEIAPG